MCLRKFLSHTHTNLFFLRYNIPPLVYGLCAPQLIFISFEIFICVQISRCRSLEIYFTHLVQRLEHRSQYNLRCSNRLHQVGEVYF